MNIRKRILSYSIVTPLLLISLVGCLPLQEESPDATEFDRLPSVIAPSVQVEEKYYRGLQPFVSSKTRGSLQTSLSRYRLDSDRLELGLLEIAQDYFPTESHLFREGQIIGGDNYNLSNWLKVKSGTNKLGLNPEDTSDRILLHILEHNYINLQGEQLEGIVIGLSLASIYTVEKETEGAEQGTKRRETLHYTEDELRIHGARMADIIAERIRAQFNAPIVIALYQLEEQHSLVPGNFLSVGYVERDQNYVSKWDSINETYFLFPSNALTRFDRDFSKTYSKDFADFKTKVQEFFPNYIGIIGDGRVIDEQLVELTVTITTEFASKTEVIQLTQFLGGTAIDMFSENVHLNIYVQAINQPQAVFVRPINGEPVMHIYR